MTTSVLKRDVLILNNSWTPISTKPLEHAISMLFPKEKSNIKARILNPEDYQLYTWEDWSKLKPSLNEAILKSTGSVYKVPEIILLTNYNKIPSRRMSFSRRTIYQRDQFCCQYCGKKPGTNELSIDHVIPKSRGGLTSWENCVIACVSCNVRKADKTLKEAGMKLLKQPVRPRWTWLKANKNIPHSWKNFLPQQIVDEMISEAYWTTELVD